MWTLLFTPKVVVTMPITEASIGATLTIVTGEESASVCTMIPAPAEDVRAPLL
jgi:hypothetical protein